MICWVLAAHTVQCQPSPDRRIFDREISSFCTMLLQRPNSYKIDYSFNKALIVLQLDSTGKRVIGIKAAATLQPSDSASLVQESESMKRNLSKVSFPTLTRVPLSKLKNASIIVEALMFKDYDDNKAIDEGCINRDLLDKYYRQYRRIAEQSIILSPLVGSIYQAPIFCPTLGN